MASVICSPNHVERGNPVHCTVQSNLAFTVLSWAFMGGGFIRSGDGGGATWQGTAVIGGTVSATISVGQRDTVVAGAYSIMPRVGGIWTQTHWESQLSYVQGQGSAGCAQSQRPIPGARLGWTGSLSGASSCQGQQIEPIGSGGYTLTQGSGPNVGIWYVSGASFFVKSTSQLHPGMGTAYQLTNTQQETQCNSALGRPSGSPVTISFLAFNGTCQNVSGWGEFVDALWAHEEQHFLKARDELKKPGSNIYVAIHSIVEGSDFDATSRVLETYNRIQDAIRTASSVEPTGNWTTPFWLWASDTNNSFVLMTGVNF